MIKASVKKPFTILVAVVMIIALGVVSLMNMTADLLPEFSLPYMIVITTYPGAGPEKVEAAVTQPMEAALGTINGVKNISSSSGDNYSTVQLEFEDDTDMSAALVKVSNAINTVKSYLPAEAGTPTVMEIHMDIRASTYLGVAFELSHFVEDEVIPYLERQNGVANVNSVGLVAQSIVIELDEDKIQDVNDRILASTDKAFADARQKLIDAKETLEKNQKKLDDSYKDIEDGYKEIEDGYQKIEDSKVELKDKWNDYYSALGDFNNAKDELSDNIYLLESTAESLPLLIENKRMMIDGARTAVAARQTAQTGANSLPSIRDSIPQIYQLSSHYAANPATAFYVITDQSPFLPTIGMYNVATATDLVTDPTYPQLITALNTTYYVASEAGIITSTDYTTSFGGVYNKLDESVKASNDGLKTIDKNLDQIIGAYNGLRQGAGLQSVTWTAVTLDNAKIDIMEETWDGLWGSTSAYARATVLMLNAQKAQLEASKSQLDSAKTQLENADEQIEKSYEQLEDGKKQLEDAKEQLADAQKQIDDGWDSYYDGVKQLNKQRQEVLKTANADQLVSLNTLSQLVYAQNFEMPAGYIDDENDNSWLIKIGQNFESAEDMQDIVLTYIDKVGDIRLSDVAHITYIDNVGQSYAKMNGNNAVLLAIFKSSTASTNAVSKLVDKAMAELQEKYNGLSVVTLLDQGDYIDMLVQSVMES
ncbi:MAG: efflux RND transporter permease subunit, partial [Clostridia bacterium]|nr:efflux RND transporter permease subunit [Clostridia bacterium]